jgi:predicted CXXCH cytochrome family protein
LFVKKENKMFGAISSHAFILLLLTFFLTGCDPQTRHQTLTFFFTGVPPLDEIKEQQKPAPTAPPDKQNDVASSPSLFSHPIWESDTCSPCHDSTSRFKIPGSHEKSVKIFRTGGGMPGKLLLPRTRICIQCHTDKTPKRAMTENLWLHNTTAKGDCLACHDPHQTKYKNTLRQQPAVLCLPCHKEGNFLITPVHQTEEGCLTCHNPHMGKNKNILSKDYKEIKIPAAKVPKLGKMGW